MDENPPSTPSPQDLNTPGQIAFTGALGYGMVLGLSWCCGYLAFALLQATSADTADLIAQLKLPGTSPSSQRILSWPWAAAVGGALLALASAMAGLAALRRPNASPRHRLALGGGVAFGILAHGDVILAAARALLTS